MSRPRHHSPAHTVTSGARDVGMSMAYSQQGYRLVKSVGISFAQSLSLAVLVTIRG